jgi:hypothetical protein
MSEWQVGAYLPVQAPNGHEAKLHRLPRPYACKGLLSSLCWDLIPVDWSMSSPLWNLCIDYVDDDNVQECPLCPKAIKDL